MRKQVMKRLHVATKKVATDYEVWEKVICEGLMEGANSPVGELLRQKHGFEGAGDVMERLKNDEQVKEKVKELAILMDQIGDLPGEEDK